MRHTIESCDAPNCQKTREFVLKGTNSAPQDGWFTLHIMPSDENRPHILKSACSVECAAKIVTTTLQLNSKDDCAIEFCPGHKEGHQGRH